MFDLRESRKRKINYKKKRKKNLPLTITFNVWEK